MKPVTLKAFRAGRPNRVRSPKLLWRGPQPSSKYCYWIATLRRWRGLFRYGVQIGSGPGDLVVHVGRHDGHGRRLAPAGEGLSSSDRRDWQLDGGNESI